jgi:DNA-binding transcriptional MerR regulator
MNGQDKLSINSVADKLGLSVHQLRRWELMFNLEIKRGRGQQRQYRQEDLSVLERIKELVEQGWPTSQIRPQLEAEGLVTPRLIGMPTSSGNPEVLMESVIGLRNFTERRFIEISRQIDELRQLLISITLKQELSQDKSSPWQPLVTEFAPAPRPMPAQEFTFGPQISIDPPASKPASTSAPSSGLNLNRTLSTPASPEKKSMPYIATSAASATGEIVQRSKEVLDSLFQESKELNQAAAEQTREIKTPIIPPPTYASDASHEGMNIAPPEPEAASARRNLNIPPLPPNPFKLSVPETSQIKSQAEAGSSAGESTSETLNAVQPTSDAVSTSEPVSSVASSWENLSAFNLNQPVSPSQPVEAELNVAANIALEAQPSPIEEVEQPENFAPEATPILAPMPITPGPQVNFGPNVSAPTPQVTPQRVDDNFGLGEVTDQNYLTVLGRALDLIGWTDEQADSYSLKTFGVPHWDELGRSQAEKLVAHLIELLKQQVG